MQKLIHKPPKYFANCKQLIQTLDLDLFLVYFMISYLTATTQPLNTEEYMALCPLSWLKKHIILIILVCSLFKPVKMRSCNFRNGVTWSYTEYEAHSSCCFHYTCNSRTNELLEHQKLNQMIFQQPGTFNSH